MLLSRIRTLTEHLERRYELPVPAGANEAFRLASPAELIADVHKDERKVRLKGRVRATLELDCSRCLEAFQVPVDATFDMLFLPAVEPVGDAEREVAEDDFGVSYYRDETIDLMQRYSISQLPVMRHGSAGSLADVVGSLQERGLLDLIFRNPDSLNEEVAAAMQPPLAAVEAGESVDEVFSAMTGGSPAVVVATDGKPTGMLTRSDLLEYLAHGRRNSG
jgi:hypothetical protein